MNRTVVYMLSVLLLTTSLWADRLMDPNETDALIKQLTETPRQFWISKGMIQARHLEYYDYENTVKEAIETVYHDGIRCRLEIRLNDNLVVDNSLIGSRQDFKLNQNSIFIRNGQKFTQYYQSADYAIVTTDNQNSLMESRGPLTAGIIPWGHADFSYLVLMSHAPQSYELSGENQNIILLEYINESINPPVRVSFVLDGSKDHAVLSYSIENDQALLRQTYQDYLQAANQWAPSKVLIERFDKRSGEPLLLSYEDWQFETIDTTEPSDDLFSIQFKKGTTVELKPAGKAKTFLYHASDHIDISQVLEDKITFLETQEPDSVNCATVAIQHIAKRFSKNILNQELSGLVSEDTKTTTLREIKQVLEDAGLNCMAVTTDLETLERIPNCTVILHLSLSNHYVILDHVDEDGIWVIDLTSRRFYAKRKIDDFLQEWGQGAALLVSNEPITPPLDANLNYLEANEMSQIQGGDFGIYSCSDHIQYNEHVLCPDPIGGFLCGGAYYIFYERYGCQEDENGGTCAGEMMLSYEYYHCFNNPYIQGVCNRDDISIPRYIRACN